MFLALDNNLSHSLATLIPHIPLFDIMFRALSFTGSSILLWVTLVLVVSVWEILSHSNKRAFTTQFLKFALTFGFTLGLIAMSITYVIKPLVRRDRPYQALHIQTVCPKDSSFPSGHAAAAVAGAYILAKFDHDKRRRVGYILLAGGISYSRIYLYCHYVGDVVGGLIYGGILAGVMYEVVHYLYHKARNSR